MAASWRSELRPLGRLAWPVILAEIGWMAMGIVDTLMVGPLGPEAIGGVGLAGILFFALAACGMGLLLGLDTVVSQAYGAGDHDACRRWLWQGLWLGLFAAVPLAGLLWLQRTWLDRFGVNPAIIAVVRGNLDVLWLTLLPLFVYAASRRYLQAIGLVRPVMFALVAANIVNAIGNWALIYGHLGLPALGTDGAAWATCVARIAMAVVPLAAIVWYDLRHHPGTPVWRVRWQLDPKALATLLRLGVPAMLQMVFEVGVFALASSMAASQTPTAIAAHQVSLELAGLAYMVPLGIASAAAVRVGHAVGRRDGPGAEHAGWAAILMGTTDDGDDGAPLRAAAAAPDRRVHARPRRDPDRHLAARRRRGVRGLRWRAGDRDRRPARPRRDPAADDLEPRRALGHRPADRLDAGVRRRVGRARHLDRPLDRPHRRRRSR